METDKELAIRYMPELVVDKKVTVAVGAVGYTCWGNIRQSGSFPKRTIEADWKKIKYVNEVCDMV